MPLVRLVAPWTTQCTMLRDIRYRIGSIVNKPGLWDKSDRPELGLGIERSDGKSCEALLQLLQSISSRLEPWQEKRQDTYGDW